MRGVWILLYVWLCGGLWCVICFCLFVCDCFGSVIMCVCFVLRVIVSVCGGLVVLCDCVCVGGFTSWEIKLKSESQKWLKKSEIYVFSLQFRVNSHIYRTSGCQTFVYLNFMFFELSASDFRRKHPHPHP